MIVVYSGHMYPPLSLLTSIPLILFVFPVNLSSTFMTFSFWDPVNLIGMVYMGRGYLLGRRTFLVLTSLKKMALPPQQAVQFPQGETGPQELHPLATGDFL